MKRRSSILKPAKSRPPLGELQHLVGGGGGGASVTGGVATGTIVNYDDETQATSNDITRTRRVSFSATKGVALFTSDHGNTIWHDIFEVSHKPELSDNSLSVSAQVDNLADDSENKKFNTTFVNPEHLEDDDDMCINVSAALNNLNSKNVISQLQTTVCNEPTMIDHTEALINFKICPNITATEMEPYKDTNNESDISITQGIPLPFTEHTNKTTFKCDAVVSDKENCLMEDFERLNRQHSLPNVNVRRTVDDSPENEMSVKKTYDTIFGNMSVQSNLLLNNFNNDKTHSAAPKLSLLEMAEEKSKPENINQNKTIIESENMSFTIFNPKLNKSDIQDRRTIVFDENNPNPPKISLLDMAEVKTRAENINQNKTIVESQNMSFTIFNPVLNNKSDIQNGRAEIVDENKPNQPKISLLDMAEEKPKSLLDLAVEKPKSLLDLAVEKPKSLLDMAEEKPKSLLDMAEEKPKSLLDMAEEKPKSLLDMVEEKPRSLLDMAEEKPKSSNTIQNKTIIESQNMSLTIFDSKPVNKSYVQGRRTTIFDENNPDADMSLTMLSPDIRDSENDENVQKLNKSERRKTIVSDSIIPSCDMSMTCAVPNPHVSINNSAKSIHTELADTNNVSMKRSKLKRQTIVFDNDHPESNMSMTVPIRQSVNFSENSEPVISRSFISEQTQLGGNMSITHVIPTNFEQIQPNNDTKESANSSRRKTIVFDQQQSVSDMSMTKIVEQKENLQVSSANIPLSSFSESVVNLKPSVMPRFSIFDMNSPSVFHQPPKKLSMASKPVVVKEKLGNISLNSILASVIQSEKKQEEVNEPIPQVSKESDDQYFENILSDIGGNNVQSEEVNENKSLEPMDVDFTVGNMPGARSILLMENDIHMDVFKGDSPVLPRLNSKENLDSMKNIIDGKENFSEKINKQDSFISNELESINSDVLSEKENVVERMEQELNVISSDDNIAVHANDAENMDIPKPNEKSFKEVSAEKHTENIVEQIITKENEFNILPVENDAENNSINMKIEHSNINNSHTGEEEIKSNEIELLTNVTTNYSTSPEKCKTMNVEIRCEELATENKNKDPIASNNDDNENNHHIPSPEKMVECQIHNESSILFYNENKMQALRSNITMSITGIAPFEDEEMEELETPEKVPKCKIQTKDIDASFTNTMFDEQVKRSCNEDKSHLSLTCGDLILNKSTTAGPATFNHISMKSFTNKSMMECEKEVSMYNMSINKSNFVNDEMRKLMDETLGADVSKNVNDMKSMMEMSINKSNFVNEEMRKLMDESIGVNLSKNIVNNKSTMEMSINKSNFVNDEMKKLMDETLGANVSKNIDEMKSMMEMSINKSNFVNEEMRKLMNETVGAECSKNIVNNKSIMEMSINKSKIVNEELKKLLDESIKADCSKNIADNKSIMESNKDISINKSKIVNEEIINTTVEADRSKIIIAGDKSIMDCEKDISINKSKLVSEETIDKPDPSENIFADKSLSINKSNFIDQEKTKIMNETVGADHTKYIVDLEIKNEVCDVSNMPKSFYNFTQHESLIHNSILESFQNKTEEITMHEDVLMNNSNSESFQNKTQSFLIHEASVPFEDFVESDKNTEDENMEIDKSRRVSGEKRKSDILEDPLGEEVSKKIKMDNISTVKEPENIQVVSIENKTNECNPDEDEKTPEQNMIMNYSSDNHEVGLIENISDISLENASLHKTTSQEDPEIIDSPILNCSKNASVCMSDNSEITDKSVNSESFAKLKEPNLREIIENLNLNSDDCQTEVSMGNEWSFLLFWGTVRLRVVFEKSVFFNMNETITDITFNELYMQKPAKISCKFRPLGLKMVFNYLKLHSNSNECRKSGDLPEFLKRCASISENARNWCSEMFYYYTIFGADLDMKRLKFNIMNPVKRRMCSVQVKLDGIPYADSDNISISIVCGKEVSVDEIMKKVNDPEKNWTCLPKLIEQFNNIFTTLN